MEWVSPSGCEVVGPVSGGDGRDITPSLLAPPPAPTSSVRVLLVLYPGLLEVDSVSRSTFTVTTSGGGVDSLDRAPVEEVPVEGPTRFTSSGRVSYRRVIEDLVIQETVPQ